MENEMTIEQLVAFCVLMEKGQGIISKAPSYLMEKWKSCQMRESRNDLLGLMDLENATKFREYVKMWRIK
jgi:hypothetical protein